LRIMEMFYEVGLHKTNNWGTSGYPINLTKLRKIEEKLSYRIFWELKKKTDRGQICSHSK